MKLGLYTKIRILVKGLVFPPYYLLYKLSPNKMVIDADIKAWGKWRDYVDDDHLSRSMLILWALQPEFRLQLVWRLGFWGHFLPCKGTLGGGYCAPLVTAKTSERGLF